MSTAVALLSGKGGSGKTTLALSLADLLCRCGTKTLLVDCDLSTNGATFFYESQIYEWNRDKPHHIFSFSDILGREKIWVNPIPLTINEKLDFIPSHFEISDRNFQGATVQYNDDTMRSLFSFLNWARDNYNAILFDCQAGYSEFFPALLPMMDADLFVLETDSISASAMRNLHLKVGSHFGHARLYQVFNKATPEEFETYSKIVGTFFTNIGTLLFDWKIRQAFSRSQIPDIENTSAQYGADLCDVCKIMFADKVVRKELDNFSAQLRYRQLENERDEIVKKMDELTERRTSDMQDTSLLVLFTLLAFTVSIVLMILFDDKIEAAHWGNEILWNTLEALGITGMMAGSFLIVYFRSGIYRRVRREKMEYEQHLKKTNKELLRLDEVLGRPVPSKQDSAN